MTTHQAPATPSKSPKQKQSVRFQVPIQPQPIKSPIKRSPPTVKFEVPHTRDYLKILHQTKLVYDQLLAAKQGRLVEDLYKAKSDLDIQCAKLQDKQKAIEFGVRAQEHLNKLQAEADSELMALHKDYQSKLDKMRDSLEEKWLAEHSHEIKTDDNKSYKLFPKKK